MKLLIKNIRILFKCWILGYLSYDEIVVDVSIRFLRERYKIHIEITPFVEGYKTCYACVINDLRNTKSKDAYSSLNQSYASTLLAKEAALKHAITLIK